MTTTADDSNGAVSGNEPVSGKEARIALRERALRLFENGATGAQVAAAISDGTDRLLLGLVQLCLRAFDERTWTDLARRGAIVAVGGTGRGDLSPDSDVDLLFLHERNSRDDFIGLSAMIVRECWDSGIELGHGVRTVSETLRLARQEIEVATSLVEARHLWGSQRLFDQLRDRFRRQIGLRRRTFVERCIASRTEEREKHGGTVRQLSPDVKCSPGGLRDVHLVRWIGFAWYGSPDVDSIRLAGGLRNRDARALLNAYDFLVRVRHELHFHGGRAHDLLSRDEQLRIAGARDVEPKAGQRSVEVFMQEYLRHAAVVDDVSERFVALHRPRAALSRFVEGFLSHRVDGVYRVGGRYLNVLRSRREAVCHSLDLVVEMYRLAALSGVLPAPPLVETIKQARLRPTIDVPRGMARAFLEIMRCTSQLGPILRSMYATGALDCLVPDFERTRGLLQFNQYHLYTVDEHTLRCLEAVTALENDETLHDVYAEVGNKGLLHLALLLHDLGKGFPEDHSEVGREIAERTARRLHLTERERDTLVFLVHQHLAMTHLAFRRDITDPGVVVEFAQKVGSPDTLRMLYLLSVADLKGVGPGTWTHWKGDLLRELYERAMSYVGGKRSRRDEASRLERLRRHVLEELGEEADDGVRTCLENLPPHYLLSLDTTVIANDLRVVAPLPADGLAVHGVYEPGSETVEYRVVARRVSVTGFFLRITGTLAAQGMDVLAASISTTRDGVVIDRFDVTDKHHAGPVPTWRLNEVCAALRASLAEGTDVASLFRRRSKFDVRGVEPRSNQRTKVAVDNESSERCTVVDVFAHDRPGLLYVIGRTLYELGLTVDIAKISTHLDQVVDVFYVNEGSGAKVQEAERISEIRERLATAIDEFEREGHLQFA